MLAVWGYEFLGCPIVFDSLDCSILQIMQMIPYLVKVWCLINKIYYYAQTVCFSGGQSVLKLVEHGGMTYEGEQTLPQT